MSEHFDFQKNRQEIEKESKAIERRSKLIENIAFTLMAGCVLLIFAGAIFAIITVWRLVK